MASKCAMCIKRGQTWNGDAPECAFPNAEAFSAKNWNCATANAIRSICDPSKALPHGVACQYCDDSSYATIQIPDGLEIDGLCLYIQWYKHRGKTDQLLILGKHGARPATEEECLAIIAWYSQKDSTNGK